MSSETFKALIIDMITCLSKDQLKAVLGNISESSLEEIGKALLAEKGRKGTEVEQVEKEIEKEVEKPVEEEEEVEKVVEAKGRIIAKAKALKKVVYGRNGGKKPVAAMTGERKAGTRSKKRKRESGLDTDSQ